MLRAYKFSSRYSDFETKQSFLASVDPENFRRALRARIVGTVSIDTRPMGWSRSFDPDRIWIHVCWSKIDGNRGI